MKTRLPIKPFEKAGINHDHVSLRLDYSKRDTGPVLHVQTIHVEPATEPGGFEGERHAIFGSPSTTIVIERGWKTNNKKRLGAAEDQVLSELERRSGPTFDAIVEFLKSAGTELVVPEPIAA